MSKDYAYNGVKGFHLAAGHTVNEKPTVISEDDAIKRTIWTAEELIEFLHASVAGDYTRFINAIEELDKGIDAAIEKQLAIGPIKEQDVLVAQMDALVDTEYFIKGSFVIAGVDPEPLFNIVNNANMGKMGPDGKPIIREHDGKIMKPDNWEADFAPEPRLREEILRQMNL